MLGNFQIPEWLRGSWVSSEGGHKLSATQERVVLNRPDFKITYAAPDKRYLDVGDTLFNCPSKPFQQDGVEEVARDRYILPTTGGVLTATRRDEGEILVETSDFSRFFRRATQER